MKNLLLMIAILSVAACSSPRKYGLCQRLSDGEVFTAQAAVNKNGKVRYWDATVNGFNITLYAEDAAHWKCQLNEDRGSLTTGKDTLDIQ